MERDNSIDFYKGFLMLGVVWGHILLHMIISVGNYSEVNDINIHWIFRTYDMPAFMVLSGFFLAKSCSRYSLKTLLVNKITTILVPSVLWSILLSRGHSVDSFYFLSAIFLSSIIVIIADKCIINTKLRAFILILLCVPFYCTNRMLWNMSYLFPFFIVGYYGCLMKHYKYSFLIFLAFICSLCFWSTDYTIWNTGSNVFNRPEILPIIVFRLSIAAIGFVAVKRVCDEIYKSLSTENGYFYNLMIRSGKETLMLYILQCFILVILKKGTEIIILKLGYNPFTTNHELFGYVIAPLLSIAMMEILLQFIQLLNKNKYTSLLCGFKMEDIKRLS